MAFHISARSLVGWARRGGKEEQTATYRSQAARPVFLWPDRVENKLVPLPNRPQPLKAEHERDGST